MKIMIPMFSRIHKFCPALTEEQINNAPGVYLPHIVPTVIGFEFPRTMAPLTTYVGPLILDNTTSLSQHPKLEAWLNNKPNRSVVYLSMGSMFPLDQVSARALVDGVMNTNYSLLWSLRKNNQAILKSVNIDYERVYISEWTPQFSVLASKAIHSAILHGGYNGLSEALWNGVPVIGFPQMTEQNLNVGRLYHNRLGLRLFKETINSQIVSEALLTIDNGDYKSNINKLKKMFKLAGGAERATELIEFYSNEGYTHLMPAYAKYQWSWVQFYNVDAWILFVLILGLLMFSVIKTLCCFIKYCCRNVTKTKLD